MLPHALSLQPLAARGRHHAKEAGALALGTAGSQLVFAEAPLGPRDGALRAEAAAARDRRRGCSGIPAALAPAAPLPGRCLARVWSAGLGAQCSRAPSSNSEFCTTHSREQAHGRVDGSVPQGRLKRFLVEHRRREREAARPIAPAASSGAALTAARAGQPTAAAACPECSKLQALLKAAQLRARDIEAELREEVAALREALAKSQREGASDAACDKGTASPATARLSMVLVPMAVAVGSRRGFLLGNEGSPPPCSPHAVEPRWTPPFSLCLGRLAPELLQHLLDAREWRQGPACWSQARSPEARRMGFELAGEALEEYRHCRSQEGPSSRLRGPALFGRDASLPAPPRIMAFRHALVLANGARLRALEASLREALARCKEQDAAIFGHQGGGALVLGRVAFSVATLQLRWGAAEPPPMPRHVDGGASLLHLSLTLAGQRTVSFEALRADGRSVETIRVPCGPGDVYLGSPACCYHSVAYGDVEGQVRFDPSGMPAPALRSVLGEWPSTIVVHLRSEVMKKRCQPAWFHKSNQILAEVLAPLVAQALARDPLVLPGLQEVQRAEARLGLAAAGAADSLAPEAPRGRGRRRSGAEAEAEAAARPGAAGKPPKRPRGARCSKAAEQPAGM